MKTNSRINNETIKEGKKSKWFKRAEKRVRNRKWLSYSSQIARRILSVMEDRQDLNQKKLAAEMDVSPQYISKVLKGKENLSLETIAKFSEILKQELIVFPAYKYSRAEVKKDVAAVFFQIQGIKIMEVSMGLPREIFSVRTGAPVVIRDEVLSKAHTLLVDNTSKEKSSQIFPYHPHLWLMGSKPELHARG